MGHTKDFRSFGKVAITFVHVTGTGSFDVQRTVLNLTFVAKLSPYFARQIVKFPLHIQFVEPD